MAEAAPPATEKMAATWIDAATYQRLAQLAADNERSLAAELRLAIKSHLAKAAA
jgi:hypothetical protein